MKFEKTKYTELINSLPHMQKTEELFELCNFLGSNFELKTIVEVGVMSGGTLASFRLFFPKAIILGVDAHIIPNFISNQEKYGLLAFHGNGHDEDAVKKVIEIMPGNKIDFVFIDADHSYESVKADYLCWKDRAKVLGFHDIVVHPSDAKVGVHKLWDEIKKGLLPGQKTKEFIYPADGTSTWAGIGVLYDLI